MHTTHIITAADLHDIAGMLVASTGATGVVVSRGQHVANVVFDKDQAAYVEINDRGLFQHDAPYSLIDILTVLEEDVTTPNTYKAGSVALDGEHATLDVVGLLDSNEPGEFVQSKIHQPADGQMPDFWRITRRRADGGPSVWVADHDTKAVAFAVARRLAGMGDHFDPEIVF